MLGILKGAYGVYPKSVQKTGYELPPKIVKIPVKMALKHDFCSLPAKILHLSCNFPASAI